MSCQCGLRENNLALIWVDAEEPLDLFFLVSAVAAGVDAESWAFAAFAPGFEGGRGDP